RAQAGIPVRGADRLPAREQLKVVADRTAELVARHARCFGEEVRKLLADEHIRIVAWPELSQAGPAQLRGCFPEDFYRVLPPLAVDPARPFPYVSGGSLNLAVTVRDPGDRPELFARVKVPNYVPRFMAVSTDRDHPRFLPLEE